MMIMAIFGGKPNDQQAIVNELEEELKNDFKINHINNNSDIYSSDQKYANLSAHFLRRGYRDTVTIVTGVNAQAEYDLLIKNRAVMCILPGSLNRLFTVGGNSITDKFVFVSRVPAKLDSQAKRNLYMTPQEAFSTCYARERGFEQRVPRGIQ